MSQGSEEVRDPPAPAQPGVPRPGRARRWLWLLLFLLLALGGSYGAGRLQAAALVKRADELREQADQLRLAADNHALRLEARRRLDRALGSLDQRNFGIAEQELRAAATLFERGARGAPDGLAPLVAEIKEFRLTATEDVGEQRKSVLDWSRRFDEIAPPAAP